MNDITHDSHKYTVELHDLNTSFRPSNVLAYKDKI